MLKIIALVALLAALAAPKHARADISLDDIAPKLTKCWGNTCVMPDGSATATLYNLDTKKFEFGTVALGGGAVLLFRADQDYASGLCAHLGGLLSQEQGKSSYALWSVGAVFARYFEIAYTRRWSSDGDAAQYISFSGNVPWDVFTRATIPQRAARVKAGKLTAEDF